MALVIKWPVNKSLTKMRHRDMWLTVYLNYPFKLTAHMNLSAHAFYFCSQYSTQCCHQTCSPMCVCVRKCVYLRIMQTLTDSFGPFRWLRISDSLRTRPEWISTSCSADAPRRSDSPRFSCSHRPDTVNTHTAAPTAVGLQPINPRALIANAGSMVWKRSAIVAAHHHHHHTHTSNHGKLPKRRSREPARRSPVSSPVWRCSLRARWSLCSPWDFWPRRGSFRSPDVHPVRPARLPARLTSRSCPGWRWRRGDLEEEDEEEEKRRTVPGAEVRVRPDDSAGSRVDVCQLCPDDCAGRCAQNLHPSVM